MSRPTFAVLYAPGTNCHQETVFAIEYVGGASRIVSLKGLIDGSERIDDCEGMVVPGGFSWGDHLGAGRIFAIHLIAKLSDMLRSFVDAGKPILGICNGNQVLVETGILPRLNIGVREVALLQNRSARYESRLSALKCTAGDTFWTRGLEGQLFSIPVAHGEGRLYFDDESMVKPAFAYIDKEGNPTEAYPANPAGSPKGIAGITDTTGMVLGLMPHPERAILPWHESQDGLGIIKNLITV